MGRKDRTHAERVEPTFSRPGKREERASGYGGGGWGAYLGGGAGGVGGWAGDGLASVLGAIELISSAVSALPASIVFDGEAGPEAAASTLPAARLLRRPAPAYSWSRWASATTASLLTMGNALSYVSLDGRGAPVSIVPCPWSWVVPSVLASGRLVYDVVQATPEARALGLPAGGRLLDTDVIHVRSRADGGGLIGRSVLSRARSVIEEGRELSVVANAAWRQSARPSGWITTERVLDKGVRERAEDLINRFTGSLNTGRVPLLEDGWKFQQQTFNSVDAEFLASRAFSVAEVARVFCIPEPMLQVGRTAPADLTPYLSAFATLALSPIVTAIEDEFTHSVLPDGYRLQIDMGGLMRGSWSGIVAGAAAARAAGMISANDGRALLGLPPRADGDTLAASPGPAHFAADGPGMPHLGPSPGPTGDGLPAPGTNGNAGAG